MKRSSLSFWLGSLCALTLASPLLSQEEWVDDFHYMRTDVRYTTPEGIGYKSGYTTLEAFFSAPFQDSWLPFVDVRGHVFNNGRFAANAGLGVRYLRYCRVWGLNAYYDYRDTHRQNFNQVAAGLESLGEVWDFRINGYLPVGKKTSSFSPIQFGGFKGHSLLLKYNRDFAMKGANAEAGFHLDRFQKAQFYFAAGPYYLTGVGKTTWGGEARAVVDLCHRYLRLEGNTSYDHFFKWVGQGQVSINIPFGKRCKESKEECCSPSIMTSTLAQQRVDRHEIIPVGKQKVLQPAIDPATGSPWVFWFVNNTSSSAGTYESPYPTLLAAQNASAPNQVIYVFPGDGSTTGMNAGITLKNGQQLLGASVAHSIPTTKGSVTIPPLATRLPTLTNTVGNVVTLASNNTVSGFYIEPLVNEFSGVAGTGISNFTASQNTFVSSNLLTTNGISLINTLGQVLVSNSTFNGFTLNDGTNNGNGIYLEVDSGYTLASLNVTGSTFSNMTNPTGLFSGNGYGGNGIFVNILGGSINNYAVSNCSFNYIDASSGGAVGGGVAVNFAGGSINNLKITRSLFSRAVNAASCVLVQGSGIVANLISTDNLFEYLSLYSASGIQIGHATTVNYLTSSKDTFTDFTDAYAIKNNGTIGVLNVSGDMFNNFGVSAAIYNSIPSSGNAVIVELNSSGNTFNNFGDMNADFDAGPSQGIWNQGIIAILNSSGDTFSNFTGKSSSTQGNSNGILSTGYFLEANISNGTFTRMSENSQGINLSTSYPFSELTLSNNTFSAGANPNAGFGVSITTVAGELCLEFINNKATPSSGPSPYLFKNSGGLFNYANVSGNTGTISTSGTVPSGTCSF